MTPKPKADSETAQKILNAASVEFSRHGLAGSRVDRIAERAGVNKAMIYYHFDSKENLYQYVIDSYVSRMGRFLEEQMEEETDLEDFLRQAAAFYDRLFETYKHFVPIFLREAVCGGERLKSALSRLVSDKDIFKKLKSRIDRGKREGRFRQVDSRQAIISFMGMANFYLMLAPTINFVWEIKDEKRFRKMRQKEVVDLFLHGLLAK